MSYSAVSVAGALLLLHVYHVRGHSIATVEVDALCTEFTDSGNDCEQFYSCASIQLGCPMIKHSIVSQLCQRLNSYQASRNNYHHQVLQWARKINHCVVQRLSHQLAQDETCADNDQCMRSAMHWCALQDSNRDEACRNVLWNGRREALALFGQRNWLWLVETMRSCPHHAMTRFIKWAVMRTSSD